MDRTFRVVLDGSPAPGTDRSQALERGARIFRVELKKMDELLGGEPRVIKGNLDEETARRYVEVILEAGILCHMETQAPMNDPLTILSVEDSAPAFSCPKCKYRAPGAAEVEGAFEECPRCGIVVKKYLSQQTAARTAALQDNPLSRVSDSEYEPASMWQRRHACSGSFFVPSTGSSLIGLVAAVLLYVGNIHFFSSSMPHTAKAATKLEGIHDLHGLAVSLSAIVILLAYFVYFPSMNGRTWAQGEMHIRVVRTNPERQPDVFTWLLRAVANFACVLSVGLLSLVPLFRKDQRSLADLLSGTRQVKHGATEDQSSTFMTVVSVIAIILSASSGFFSLKLLAPPQQVEQKAVERRVLDPKVYAQENRQVLERVSRWEELHLKDYGSYSADAMELFEKYGDRLAVHAFVTLNGIDRLRLELTDSGFRAMMPVHGARDTYQVYTEKGDQGVQIIDLHRGKTRM